ncbi:MAG: flagellar biosynthesis anti-sigma factor FlgM [Thermodesulfobacteriota bacterium]|nr:flagellar biosynthesis anti-sigma factor FlgM [Thermodesulfobacteriota bacterium]
MKVSDINQKNNMLQNVGQANSTHPPEKNQKPGEADAKTASGDRVEFSTRSREMQKIYEVLQTTPEVRSDKVSEIKKRIEDGQYRVDSETLAEKIIKESILDLIK